MKYLLFPAIIVLNVLHTFTYLRFSMFSFFFFRLEIPLLSLKCDWSISKKYILRYEALYFLRN